MPAVSLYRLLGERRRLQDYVRRSTGPPVRVEPPRGPDGYNENTAREERALWRRRPEETITPEWAQIVGEAFSGETFEASEARESALVIIRMLIDAQSATWAISFGTAARHWIDPSAVDRDGHILGALSVMRDPITGMLDSLTGINAFEISLQGQRIDREIPSGSGMADFDYDRDIQVLRSARGRPIVNDVGKSVAGGESLRPTGLDAFDAIVAAISSYERNIRALRAAGEGEIPGPRPADATLSHDLDVAIADEIRSGNTDIVLALPVEAAERRVYFRPLNATQAATNHRATGVDSPSLATFRDILTQTGRIAAFDASLLHSSEIVSTQDGDDNGPWQIYKLLSGNLEYGGNTYIIEDGKWYRARRDWIDSLNARVDGVPLEDSFPAYAHVDEAEYNKTLAASLSDAIVLDRRLVRGDGFSTQIEIADVARLIRDGKKQFIEFIHIKRDFSSSSLSHLVNQSTTSAFALVEQSVRAAVAARINQSTAGVKTKTRLTNILQATPYDPDRVRIVIGIIGAWNGRAPSVAIPVLARAGLQRAIRQLTARGHLVRLARISV